MTSWVSFPHQSHYPAKFCSHRPCRKEDILFLTIESDGHADGHELWVGVSHPKSLLHRSYVSFS